MFPKLMPHMLNVSATVVTTICFNTKRRYMKDYVHKLGFSFQFDQTTQINICSQWLQNSELAYPILKMLGN